MVTAAPAKRAEEFPSNREIAAATGLTDGAISRIFSGQRAGTLATLVKMRDAMGLDTIDAVLEVIETRKDSAGIRTRASKKQAVGDPTP